METKARYVLIGLFTLAVIAGGFVFVYWLQNNGGLAERALYRIRFDGSVAGLQTGAPVLFNGIRAGEITALTLSLEDPRRVTATVALDAGTPVRADTRVGVETQGLMGGSALALTGGSPGAPALRRSGGEPPLLIADPDATQNFTSVARDTLRRLDSILSENAEPLHSIVNNLNTFAIALGRNSDRLDGIIAGVERMTGAAPAKPPGPMYDLTAPREFPGLGRIPDKQLTVREPSAVAQLETQRILVAAPDGESTFLGEARWTDSMPKLLQARAVQAFENARYMRVSIGQTDGLNADHQLLIDLRTFQLTSAEVPSAEIEFTAKILGDDGKVTAARAFRASVQAKSSGVPDVVRAFDQAFGQVLSELVRWTLGVI